MQKPDFQILEGIRGLAALVVVLNHARGSLFVGGGNYLASHDGLLDRLIISSFQITSLGLQAVIVFFVLSGFSIAHSVATSSSSSRFYLRRFVRLYPPYLAGLVLAWLTYALFTTSPVPGVTSLRSVFESATFVVSNLLYMKAGSFIPQYWSLAHEVIFYALAPLIAFRWSKPFAVIASVAFAFGLLLDKQQTIPALFLFDYAIYFAVGVLAYQYRDQLTVLQMPRPVFYAICLGTVAALAVLLRINEKASLVLSAVFSLVMIVNFESHRITSGVLRWLGSMSYTLYVTHFAATFVWVWVLNKLGLAPSVPSSNLWMWMSAIPFCLLVSWLFYLLVERPAVQLVKKLRYAPRPQGVPQTSS